MQYLVLVTLFAIGYSHDLLLIQRSDIRHCAKKKTDSSSMSLSHYFINSLSHQCVSKISLTSCCNYFLNGKLHRNVLVC